MPISASSYGSVAGVASYVKHATNASGTFDTSTKPTLTEVEAFIDRRSAILNGWLANAGYTIPVSNATAVLILAYYANVGAAGDVELSQRSGGYDADDENARENKFLSEFAKAEAYIASGALGAIGVTQPTNNLGPLAGLAVGGKTTGGLRLRPIFSRGMMNNSPDAERSGPEPDYSGDP